MKEGRFRPDLFYRLNVIQIQVPPLRQRKEDVPALVDLFIKKYAPRESKKIEGITQEAMAALLRYSFPGNIRELENIIERAVVFADSSFITLADIPVFLKEKKEGEVAPEGLSLDDQVGRLEVREIKRALIEAGGVKARAARALGITERVLGYKMKAHGLDG
jgi:transcriptional regulator with PAS, ATPase and Fis domain